MLVLEDLCETRNSRQILDLLHTDNMQVNEIQLTHTEQEHKQSNSMFYTKAIKHDLVRSNKYRGNNSVGNNTDDNYDKNLRFSVKSAPSQLRQKANPTATLNLQVICKGIVT